MADPLNLPTPQGSRRRRGYPGRLTLDAAQARLRSQLARLARDDDTLEQAGALAARAAAALDEVTEAALKAEERSPRVQGRLQREQRRMDAALHRAGLPVARPPEEPR
ncbi:hypothetical protein AB0H97_29945 [Streptomyces sp. NPDC050788]|uniref:hypothetical protein n=1 Tax=Streptomyces sp. NPDC050788 TaxID=3155041 RepID=UPI00341AD7FD